MDWLLIFLAFIVGSLVLFFIPLCIGEKSPKWCFIYLIIVYGSWFWYLNKDAPTTYIGFYDPPPDPEWSCKNKKKLVRKLKMVWAGRSPHWYYEWEEE